MFNVSGRNLAPLFFQELESCCGLVLCGLPLYFKTASKLADEPLQMFKRIP